MQHFSSDYCPVCRLKGDPEEVEVGMLQKKNGRFQCSRYPACKFSAPLVDKSDTLFGEESNDFSVKSFKHILDED